MRAKAFQVLATCANKTSALTIYRSKGGCFKLKTNNSICRRMNNLCRLRHPLETGGILIGHYTQKLDCAVVVAATGSPLDSKRSTRSFQRGIRHLQRLLDLYWATGEYYLGEWHYHSSGTTTPSHEDLIEMQKIARSPEMNCPIPLLLIVGGDSLNGFSLGSFVLSTSGRRLIEMKSKATLA